MALTDEDRAILMRSCYHTQWTYIYAHREDAALMDFLTQNDLSEDVRDAVVVGEANRSIGVCRYHYSLENLEK